MNRFPIASLAACVLPLLSSCTPSLELVDDGVIEVSGSLPLDPASLGEVARSRLRVTATLPGLVAETPLQIQGDGTLRGSLAFAIEADLPDQLVIAQVYGALGLEDDEVLLARAMADVSLVARGELEVTFLETDWIDEGDGVEAFLFDRNRNGASNLADLRDGCSPAAPPPAVALSATDLQFPSGTQPGEYVRQVVVLDNQRAGDVSWWAQVVGAPGAAIAPLEVDALTQPTPLPTVGSDESPRSFAAGDEALLAVTYAPVDSRLSTGFLVVESVDACRVRQAGAVRIIGNPDGEVAPERPSAELDPLILDLADIAQGLPLGPLDVDVEANRSLFSGQPVVLDGAPTSGASGQLAGRDVVAATLVRVPPETELGVALVDLERDFDLALVPVVGGVLGDVETLEHPGTNPEAGGVARSDQAQDVLIAVLDATGGERTGGERFTLFFRAFSVPSFTDPPLDPRVGPLGGGTVVTLHGQGFAAGSRVRIGGHDASSVQVAEDGRSLTALTPPGTLLAELNPATVVVEVPGQAGAESKVATLPEGFVYAPEAPVVLAVDPPTAPVDTPLDVAIRGSGFTTFFGGLEVLLDGAAVPATLVSSTEIAASFPGFATPAPHSLVVRLAGPEGPVETSLTGAFEVVSEVGQVPVLDGVTPGSAPAFASLPITVTGSGFLEGAQVQVGGITATTVFVDDSTLSAITPPLPAGEVSVRVRNPDGEVSVAALPFVFLAVAGGDPVLSAVSPSTLHAEVAGDTLSLFGQALAARALASAVVEGGDGTQVAATVTSLVDAFATLRVDGALPERDDLVAVLAYTDGTVVTSPAFAARAPSVYGGQAVGGAAVEGTDFSLLLAGELLFPAKLTEVRLEGPNTLTPSITSKSESTVRVAVTGALQGSYDATLAWAGGFEVTLPGAIIVNGDCGDGVATGGEECDDDDLAGQTCAGLGFFGGQLRCAADCHFDVALCDGCGNGTLDVGEACDGADLGGATCQGQGYDDGVVGCTAACTLDLSGCSVCGDGQVSGPEVCDGVQLAGATCTSLGFADGGALACRPTCATYDISACEECGDGVCSGSETNASCPADCLPTCGDGNDTCDSGETCATCPGDCTLCAPYTATVTGGGQTNTIGVAVSPITVTVVDDDGQPVPGAVITLSHPDGGRSEGESGNVAQTDAAGVATFVVTLGFEVGTQTVTVGGVAPGGVDIDGLPAVLSFTAEDLPAGTIYTLINVFNQGPFSLPPSSSGPYTKVSDFGGMNRHPDGGAVVPLPNDHRVLRVYPTGRVEVILGDGTPTNTGDGGLAVNATCYRPSAVAVEDDGAVFVACTGTGGGASGARIRRIDSSGFIELYGGTETNLYPNQGDGRPALEAWFNAPTQLELVPQTRDLLVNNQGINTVKNTVRVISASTGVVNEYQNQVACELSGDQAPVVAADSRMSVAPDGSLFRSGTWAVSGCSVTADDFFVRRPDGTSRGFGPDLAVGAVRAVAVDGAGNFFFYDEGRLQIMKLDPYNRLSVVAGDGTSGASGSFVPATDAQVNRVRDLMVLDNGDLWVAMDLARSLRVIRGVGQSTPGPAPLFEVTLDDPGPFEAGRLRPLNPPLRAEARVDGAIVTTLQIRAAPTDGHRVTQISTLVDPLGGVTFTPWGALSLQPTQTTVAVLDRVRDPVPTATLVVDLATGEFASPTVFPVVNHSGQGSQVGPEEPSPVDQTMSYPEAVAFALDGTLYVADQNNHRVLEVAPSGALRLFAGSGASSGAIQEGGDPQTQPVPYASAVAVDGAGNVYIGCYISQTSTYRIYRVDAADGLIRTFAGAGGLAADGVPAVDAQLSYLNALEWDEATGRLYIAYETKVRYVEDGLMGTVPLIVPGCVGYTNNINQVDVFSPGHLAVATYLSCGSPFSQRRVIIDVNITDGTTFELTDGFLLGAESPGTVDSFAVDEDAGVLYFDNIDGIVRRNADGTFTVITGPATGSTLQTGHDLGPVAAGPLARVDDPGDMALAPDGTLHFTEVASSMVRALSQPHLP